MLGHQKILKELKGLKESGELGHGYIFFGPDGVGKKTAAMEFAAWLENRDPEKPGTLSDFKIFAPENGTFGIDTSRRVREFLVQAPNVSVKRTAILDGADQMTDDAANALLKIAEEPPAASLIFLIVSDPSRIKDTLASRFQKIYFGTLTEKEIEEWLVRDRKITADKAKKAAKISFGRPGLALRILTDEKFLLRQKKAVEFLNHKASARDFIKGLLEDELFLNKEESFQLTEFLDALIFSLSVAEKKNLGLWHEVLKLRHTAENFGLNPKIQLLNLARFA
jgi:DNA polymerase-3 subunit delta'